MKFKNRAKVGHSVGASMERNREVIDDKMPKGRFGIEIWRQGKLVYQEDLSNGIVDVGMNALLDSFFRNQTQPATWYIGLVDNSGFSAFANADTMGSHGGWTEFTSYDEATRQAWTTVAAASRSITNTTAATFTISATGTLKGIFITSNNTKGGSTGTLWSTGALGSTLPVVDNDVVKITYTVSG